MRELIRGGVGPQDGQGGVSPWSDLPLPGWSEVPPWSDLPLNRILYIPFSIIAYSSNIFIVSFDGFYGNPSNPFQPKYPMGTLK